MLELLLAASVSSPPGIVMAFDVKSNVDGQTWSAAPRVRTASGTAAEVTMRGEKVAERLAIHALPVYDQTSHTFVLALDVSFDRGEHHVKQHIETRVKPGTDLRLHLANQGVAEDVEVMVKTDLVR